jgi:iron(III) transport system ATP-binding protein
MRGTAAAGVATGPAGRPAALPTMVAVEGISLMFGRVMALDEVSLDIATGEILCLLGPSGSGKSSLLRLVAGLERPSLGCVRIAAVEVAGPGVFVEPEHRRIGMVFQDYALFPHLTVAANVAFGLKGRARSDVGRTVAALLERLGLTRYASSYPHMLSGGERQRVALARALAPEPRVLLMDEPFSSLDDRLRDRVRQETLAVLRETHTTTIVVTHDPGEAMRIGDRIALLRAGRLLQVGSADDLYSRPATAFAARFLSDVNELVGTCRNGRVSTALGTFSAPHAPDRSAVRVCIRPQHLRLAIGSEGIRARVIAAEFLGESERLTLDVAGMESPLLLRVPGRAQLSPGDVVFLDVSTSDIVVVPDDAG